MLNTITFELLGPSKYELIEIIEQSKNKTISKVIEKETKKIYCMIRFNRNIGISEKLTDFEINEIRIYVSLPYHENLIHCYDIIIEDEFYYLIVDYFEKKTLQQLIIKNIIFFKKKYNLGIFNSKVIFNLSFTYWKCFSLWK